MNVFSLIPIAINVVDWFIKNEPTLEKDAKAILTSARDILNQMHSLDAAVSKK